MTATQVPGPDLDKIVSGTLGCWAPPLVMGVMGDQEVFKIVADGLEESHMSVPGHALRVAQATVIGMTKPENGSYAARLREAHQRWGVSSELVARVWQWATVFVAIADRQVNGDAAADIASSQLYAAGQIHGGFINADVSVVCQPLSVQQVAVDAHFRGINSVTESAVSGFWEVADHPRIRELLPPNATDKQVLQHCSRYLPAGFVALFTR